ncbi:MAG: phosphatidylserine synthase [Paracoccaceae bacterium]|jgi:phosphatidylserine synthase
MGALAANFTYRNLANATSLLGVLPLAILFLENGYLYVIPLIIFNNFIDDLDGVLAAKLNIRSRFGADLDNVCDAVAHISLALAVGAYFGNFVIVASAIAAGAILIRIVTRLNPDVVNGTGSQTNELMRHMLFVLLLAGQFGFSPEYILIAVFLIHAVSMLLPYPLPHPIIDNATSATRLGLVNIALLTAWLVPVLTPIIAGAFVTAYGYSFVMGSIGRQKKPAIKPLLKKPVRVG